MSPAPEDPPQATVTGIYAGADLAPGSLLAERYRIEGLLGVGGMGVVYRATDTALDVPVAIKLLRPELAQRAEAFDRFRQELLLARQVSSPHVVRIHDIARDGARWFITMDLIEGEPLDRVLDRRGALPVEEALAIARQLALGLGAAHARGVVHRDLKPSNVLLDHEARACIADFGVARSLGTSGLTHSGAVVGTPDYLSPEQARGGAVDARSDLYALGLLLYEMLSGKLPFNAATPSEAISQRLAGSPPGLRSARPDAPAWVERLVAHLLRPNPAHRFQDAAAVVAAIDQRRAPRDWRPGLRLAAALALLAALIAAGLAWWPRPSGVAPATPPPPRVLVLTPGAADDGDTLLAEAYAERLRLALDATAGVAVVDAERTRQAALQLGLQEGSALRLEALREELPGARVLRLAHATRSGQGRLRAWLREPGQDERELTLGEVAPASALAHIVAALHPGAPPGTPAALPAAPVLARQAEAQRLRFAGRLADAVAALQDATTQAPDDAAGWLALAETAWFAGLPEESQQALERGARVAPPALQPRFAAQRAFLDGDLDAAVAPLRARLADTPADLAARLRLGYLQGELGALPAALETLQQVGEADPGEPRAWFLRGKYSILRGDVRAAVDEFLVRALVLYKRGRNAHGEAETVNALGVGYARLGQVDDAEEQYRKALALRRAVGNRRGIASSLRNLAQIATVRGQYDAADRDLLEARELFEALGDASGLAAVDNELGLLAEERGDYAAALAAYRNALRGREALDDALGAAESLNNIGFAHYQLGDYDSAQVFWRQAEEAFVRLDDQNGIARTRQNLGLLETARGNWTRARALLQQSLGIAQKQQFAEEEAVSRRNLAELDLLQGRYADALAHLARAETLFAERDDQRGRVDAALLRARLQLDAGDPVAAAAALDAPGEALAQASTEQRAIAALLRAELADRISDAGAKRAALDQVEALLGSGATRLLRLHHRLLRDPADASLPAEVDALGHRPLWLRLQRQLLQREVAAGQREAAARRYREVASQLAALGDYAEAWRLHRLGASVLAGEEATAATAAAAQALAALRGAAPEALRTSIDQEAAR
jgi:tetratricopeptide (TPR) repeat protein